MVDLCLCDDLRAAIEDPWVMLWLPKSLRPQWEARLAELGLTPDSPDIPEDLTTEKGWRG